MKLLRLFLASASIALASTAAAEEALPDWMNIEIQVDLRKAKPSPDTVGDYVALAKTALQQKTGISVPLEFPEGTLATPIEQGMGKLEVEAKKGMSVRNYLELVVQGAQTIGSPLWEKSGENGVRFVPIISRVFPFTYEAWQKLEKTGGKLSTERFEEMVTKSGLQLSKECQFTWHGSPKCCLIAKGRAEDVRALEKLVSPIDGHPEQK